jgi:hypothetical protein
MATISSRVLSSGALSLNANGSFDEVTFNPNAGSNAVTNLLSYSQDFTNASYWTPSAITNTPNSVVAPDGTLTASTFTATAAFSSLGPTQTNLPNPTVGQIVTVSVYVKNGNITPGPNQYFSITNEITGAPGLNPHVQTFELGSSSLGTPSNLISSSITSVGGGWFRCSVTYTYSNTAYALRPKFWIGTYTSTNYAGSYVYLWGAQVEYGSVLTPYQPKVASTNLLRYSEEFDNASYWVKNALTGVTPNATTAPDGTLTADKLISPIGTSIRKSIYQIIPVTLTAGTIYTWSVYVKAAGFTTAVMWIDTVNNAPPDNRTPSAGFWGSGCLMDLTNGSCVSSTNYPGAVYGIDAGNGWYRLVLSTKITVTGSYACTLAMGNSNGAANEVGNGVDGLYVWGAQLEIGSSVTPYKKTTLNTNIVLPRFVKRDSANTYYIGGEYDEVTFNPTTPRVINIYPYSDNWTTGVQGGFPQNLTVTSANTVAPDGTLTGTRITSTITGGNDTSSIQKLTSTISKDVLPWCASLYVKQGTSPVTTMMFAFVNSSSYKAIVVSLTWSTLTLSFPGSYFASSGTLSIGMSDAGNGWYRIYASMLNYFNGSQIAARVYSRDAGTANVLGEYSYIWGLQVEQGYTPSPYQSTGLSNTITTPRFANRITNTGNSYVKQEYDEWTGVPITDGLVIYNDAAVSSSYTPGSTTWTNLANTTASGVVYGVSGGNGGVGTATLTSDDLGYDYSSMSIKINDNRVSTNCQIRIPGATSFDYNGLATSNNFTVMFAAKKDYHGLGGNGNGDTEFFQAVGNGYNTGWRIQEINQNVQGFPMTAVTHTWAMAISPAAVPAGWGITINDTTPNRWCIVAFSVSPTTGLGFCNGNTTTRTNPGTYYGGASPSNRGWINYSGAGSGTFNGRLGFFMVYNRALTVAEMTYNFNQFRRRYGL